MKICIPTANDRGLDAPVFGHFGSAPFFTIVDSDGDELQVITNAERHGADHSCHHIDKLKAYDVGAVVCSGVGKRALVALQQAGIDVLAVPEAAVSGVVEAVRSGTARQMTVDQACGGRHAHGPSAGHLRGREAASGAGRGAGCRHRHGAGETHGG